MAEFTQVRKKGPAVKYPEHQQTLVEMGFDAVDVGGLRSAEMLESLAKLWSTLAFEQGIGPNIAFKLLHK